jgi:hypothetical protein
MRWGSVTERRSRERGQVSIEFLGFLPILLFLALAGVQLGLGAYTAQQAGTAARAAARTATHDNPAVTPERAGRAAISDWLADDTRIDTEYGGAYDEVTYTAKVKIPSLVPFVDFGDAEKSVTMPRD